ncbi:major facilitator superfamily transporter [Nitzschia inconspicua]|uniref:Major facilitator superfamily transporter n=1 Tax=Nitzschia inconspicua TaxID=303405 RepID=A0A9K3LG54_9STRA|nr:major facilitator superfamily transporter [Nitzschia inconspicua]
MGEDNDNDDDNDDNGDDDLLGRKSLSFDIELDMEYDKQNSSGNRKPLSSASASSPWKIPLPSSSFQSSRSQKKEKGRSISTSTSLLLPRRRQQQQQQQPYPQQQQQQYYYHQLKPYRDHPDDVDNSLGGAHDEFTSSSLSFGSTIMESLTVRTTESNSRGDKLRHDGSTKSTIFMNAAPTTNHEMMDASTLTYHRPQGLAGWFFGFMYEETFNESFDYDDSDEHNNDQQTLIDHKPPTNLCNALNAALFASYIMTSAATSLPILLIPSISHEFVDQDNEASAFTSLAASSALLGTACGKFLNGPVGDVYGARRTSTLYATLLAMALVGLAVSRTVAGLTTACFYVEFFQSVQWPCTVVVLATHYRPPHHIQYESGIYLTSIAGRLGALLGIPLFSILLGQFHWRIVCLIGAWVAMVGSSIMYLFVTDSPNRVNEPQNPLQHHLIQELAAVDLYKTPRRCLLVGSRVAHSMFLNNILPSFRRVLLSGTFWIVALAHTGSAMVRTSERILGSYYLDTSMGYLSENQAGSFSVSMSMGTILGLAIAGKLFAQRKERQRKRLVSRLYIVTIGACYFLAILAIPRLRYMIDSPELILFFQLLSSLIMGFGIAVMYSLIPSLVGSAFANHKGLYFAYTDGVANGISSLVWMFVAGAVENGNPEGGGWAYGWAAVALLIVLCAILMVEFMEHYFVQKAGRHHGTYETMIFA